MLPDQSSLLSPTLLLQEAMASPGHMLSEVFVRQSSDLTAQIREEPYLPPRLRLALDLL